MTDQSQPTELYVVEGASPALLNNDMATRRGRKLHLAKKLNTFKRDYDQSIRTLCNLVVYDTEVDEFHEDDGADCGNCLVIASRKGLL